MWRLGWGSAVSVRDHGGNLEQARATYGGVDWIDLSTGINRVPYPVPALSAEAFSALPTQAAMAGLLQAGLFPARMPFSQARRAALSPWRKQRALPVFPM